MIRRFRYVSRIRNDRDRQLIISGSILAMICIGLCINLAIILTKRSSNQKSINNGTNETANYILNMTTTTDLPHIVTSLNAITNFPFQVEDHTLSNPVQFETYGHQLNNAIYCSYALVCRVNGYVISITLRLFREWKGNGLLYVFVLASDNAKGALNIVRRHAVNPHRNTTEWQTINIPLGLVPVSLGSLFGIGMQENGDSRNEIYAVRATYPFVGLNITENTTSFIPKWNNDIGVAFGFTVLYYTELPTVKSTTMV